ncbi:alpha/beta fold hydrolase [Streptacidiphilus cavernicola]|uniref:Alpha/beta fold hydrolase n=1 Tax=Streptacidiphilus cavernicola TaxID=3342716 RepID=A0ABV6VQQ3_9ACTN
MSTSTAFPSAAPTATAEVGGLRMRYRATGDGDPVLLLHGIGRSLEDWSEQHDRLSAEYRVISLDLPGFGHSDRLPGPSTLTGLASALPGFLDAVGASGPVHAVGNSLGGAVAMRLAADRPERVRSLLLANSAGFGQEVTIALRVLAIRPLGGLLLRPSRTGAARTTRAIFHDRSFATPERIELALALAGRPAHNRTLLEVARDLGGFRGVSEPWRTALLAELAGLDLPTLVVWGDRDLILPAAHLDAARAALPRAESHLFTDTGHMPQIERADAFAALASAFFARDRGTS